MPPNGRHFFYLGFMEYDYAIGSWLSVDPKGDAVLDSLWKS